MSGAVGTGASFGKNAARIQDLVMQDLGLKPVLIANQIVQRDRYAEIIQLLALIASSLDKIAREIRNLARTEIAEVSEPFKEKQVGSSTMPHKRNPHKSERICSLARVIKSHVFTALENVTLEHERDLTNSASERIIIPESFILLDYMIHQLTSILKGLVFEFEAIKANLNRTKGLVFAENIMLKLVEKGLGRQDAHELLRAASMKVISEKTSFEQVLLTNPAISKLVSQKELKEWLSPENYIGTAVQQVENVVSVIKEYLSR